MSKLKEQFCGLNLLRFILSITIILCHYSMAFFGAKPEIANTPIQYMFLYGGYSVEVFFAISGLVLYWNYAHKLRPINIANFTKNVDGGGGTVLVISARAHYTNLPLNDFNYNFCCG